MLNWPEILRVMKKGEEALLVTVVSVTGSSPREEAAKMLVLQNGFWGTIGGGNMEYQAITKARELLTQQPVGYSEWHYATLTPRFDQCCGGQVRLAYEKISFADTDWLQSLDQIDSSKGWLTLTLAGEAVKRQVTLSAEYQTVISPQFDSSSMTLIEPLFPSKIPVVIFGAGHVGQALVNQLQLLETRITWIDWREELSPKFDSDKVTFINQGSVESLLEKMEPGSFYLVMTHSHQLDFELVSAILKKTDFQYLGLIGSLKKKQRFMKALSETFDISELERITCPIGLQTIHGKSPELIAASVTAQLLEIQTKISIDSASSGQEVLTQGKKYV